MRVAAWWRGLRYHFVPPSIFPAVLGALVAWAVNRTFSVFYFVLVLIGVIFNHVALNMADDYFDFKHAVDRLKPEEKNPYTGGSGTLSSGLIRPSSMFRAFSLCFAVTIAIGLFLVVTRGLPVLVFGLVGVFCSVFYTAPPVSFSHYGLGEVGMLVNFGTTLGLGSYFVQTQTISLEAFVATLPLGIMLFSMIMMNEVPDCDEDRQAGKLTLVARYGKSLGAKLYAISWICTYSIIIFAVSTGIMPPLSLIALISLPLVARSVQVLSGNLENLKMLPPANFDMIRAHSLTGFGLIAAYSVSGIIGGSDPFELLWTLVLLAAVYAPALFAMRRSKKS